MIPRYIPQVSVGGCVVQPQRFFRLFDLSLSSHRNRQWREPGHSAGECEVTHCCVKHVNEAEQNKKTSFHRPALPYSTCCSGVVFSIFGSSSDRSFSLNFSARGIETP